MGLKTAAIAFGIVFLTIGILGFVPEAAPDNMLFGVFHVNFAHSAIHLLSGAAALLCGFGTTYSSRMYFRVFGIIYAAVAILGLVQGNGLLLGMISNNMADVWLHFVIAVTSLVLGFAVPQRVVQPRHL